MRYLYTILLALVLGFVFSTNTVFADSGDNVSGRAWSANIGYISFNCTNSDTCGVAEEGGGAGTGYLFTPQGNTLATQTHATPTRAWFKELGNMFSSTRKSINLFAGIFSPKIAMADEDFFQPGYGVSVNPTTGVMTGYAWSNRIGFVSFNEGVGCPDGECTPKLDLSTGKLSGWAKASVPAGSGISGWDGWISLSCENSTSLPWCLTTPTYRGQYNFDTKIISGAAWGSNVVGWISFSGPGYAVTVDLSQPTVNMTATTGPGMCPGDVDTATLNWATTGDMTACTANSSNGDPSFSGPVGTVSPVGGVVVSPSAPSTTYSISCTKAGTDNVYSDSVTIGDVECANTDLIISAEPSPASCANAYLTRLTWSSPSHTVFASCIGDDGLAGPYFDGPQLVPGGSLYPASKEVSVPVNPTNFKITCTEPDGTQTTASTSIARLCEAPTCDISEAYLSGAPLKTTIAWSTTGTTTRTASASPSATGWSGTKAISGTQSGIQFTNPNTNYILDVVGAADSAQCNAVLNRPRCSDGTTNFPCDCVDPDPNDPNGAICDAQGFVDLSSSVSSLPVGGGTVKIKWDTQDVYNGVGASSSPTSDFGPVTCGTDGNEIVAITTSTIFRLDCLDDYTNVWRGDMVTVMVDGTDLACDFDPATTDIPDCDCPPGLPVEACLADRTRPIYIER
ncbi:MAG: hypothetical protein KBB88_01600 [Candidatus Pacebacteria bacterium]|nr:hypothetical protein [Candidatus Paceibacterota bacterium]